MSRAILKMLAVTVALLFLVGAVITAVNAVAATPGRDGGASVDSGAAEVDRTFFPATKSAPMPRPRRDGGAPVFFPASKSMGGEGLPRQQQPTQQTGP